MISIVQLPCMQAHSEHVRVCSWLGNLSPCSYSQRDLYVILLSNNHHAFLLVLRNQDVQRGINRMLRPHRPVSIKIERKKIYKSNKREKYGSIFDWIRTILSSGFGTFPSLNWMIFCVVGRNWLHPVHGDRAEWSWPRFDEPDNFCFRDFE